MISSFYKFKFKFFYCALSLNLAVQLLFQERRDSLFLELEIIDERRIEFFIPLLLPVNLVDFFRNTIH